MSKCEIICLPYPVWVICFTLAQTLRKFSSNFSCIPKPVWAVGFALEQTLRDATLAVFSFLILKRLQHKLEFYKTYF
ncbi:MAG: hypothetical protein LBH59_03420 [Planctomycetaceae bacterium]|nr:hypothetical protein [Planctomycetaceae bacterium]